MRARRGCHAWGVLKRDLRSSDGQPQCHASASQRAAALLPRCAADVLTHAPDARARSDRALASLPPPAAAAVTLRWKPFLLAPPDTWAAWGADAATQGVDKIAYYDKRFGKDAWKARRVGTAARTTLARGAAAALAAPQHR